MIVLKIQIEDKIPALDLPQVLYNSQKYLKDSKWGQFSRNK